MTGSIPRTGTNVEPAQQEEELAWKHKHELDPIEGAYYWNVDAGD